MIRFGKLSVQLEQHELVDQFSVLSDGSHDHEHGDEKERGFGWGIRDPVVEAARMRGF